MRVVYFGSDVFIDCFEYLVQKHEVLALYTYHNEEDYFTEFSIAARAKRLGIPVHYESIMPEQIIEYFTEKNCDLFFVAEYNRILQLPENFPAFKGINTHSSLLPQGRSYYPIEAAMERNVEKTGVTMHKLAPLLDKGDILMQSTIDITPEMDSVDIYIYCAAHARKMIEYICNNFEKVWDEAIPQSQEQIYWKRPDTELLILHHEMCRAEALSLFRKFNSLAQVNINGEWYHITALADGEAPLSKDFERLGEDRILYRIADGHLRLHIHPMEVSQ